MEFDICRCQSWNSVLETFLTAKSAGVGARSRREFIPRDAMNLISLCMKEFCQIGPILASDSCKLCWLMIVALQDLTTSGSALTCDNCDFTLIHNLGLDLLDACHCPDISLDRYLWQHCWSNRYSV
jgi:hypothetical protein